MNRFEENIQAQIAEIDRKIEESRIGAAAVHSGERMALYLKRAELEQVLEKVRG